MPNWAGIVNNVQKQSSTLASTSVVLFALIGNRNECARKLPGRVLAHPYTHSAAIKYVGGSGFREEKVKGEPVKVKVPNHVSTHIVHLQTFA